MKTDLVNTDGEGKPQIEPQYFLLDCELPEQEVKDNFPATWDYLQTGIEKTSKKYLCKSRKNGIGKNKE